MMVFLRVVMMKLSFLFPAAPCGLDGGKKREVKRSGSIEDFDGEEPRSGGENPSLTRERLSQYTDRKGHTGQTEMKG
jgi:hypothetical protein